MSLTHYEVATHFAKRSSDKDRHGSNVFTGNANRVIYSYGYHFPMALANDDRKIVIINGDRYSVTTAKHQGDVRGAIQSYLPKDYQSITVPFSVLQRANVIPENVVPLDTSEEIEEAVCETHNVMFTHSRWDSAYLLLQAHIRENTDCKTRYFHQLGGSLFKTKNHYQSKWKYFISGFDNTHSSSNDGFFVSLLPHPVTTIADAYESLKPIEVRKAIDLGIEVLRQGDVFAIPVPTFNARRLAKERSHKEDVYAYRYHWLTPTSDVAPVSKRIEYPMLNESHGASEVARKGKAIYARGTLVHRPSNRDPEHKRISLGKTWHRIYFNTALGSWSIGGRVD